MRFGLRIEWRLRSRDFFASVSAGIRECNHHKGHWRPIVSILWFGEWLAQAYINCYWRPIARRRFREQ